VLLKKQSPNGERKNGMRQNHFQYEQLFNLKVFIVATLALALIFSFLSVAEAALATKQQIMDAQKYLKQLGRYGGEATGTLDEPTVAAVKQFQSDKKMNADGDPGRRTIEALKNEIASSQGNVTNVNTQDVQNLQNIEQRIGNLENYLNQMNGNINNLKTDNKKSKTPWIYYILLLAVFLLSGYNLYNFLKFKKNQKQEQVISPEPIIKVVEAKIKDLTRDSERALEEKLKQRTQTSISIDQRNFSESIKTSIQASIQTALNSQDMIKREIDNRIAGHLDILTEYITNINALRGELERWKIDKEKELNERIKTQISQYKSSSEPRKSQELDIDNRMVDKISHGVEPKESTRKPEPSFELDHNWKDFIELSRLVLSAGDVYTLEQDLKNELSRGENPGKKNYWFKKFAEIAKLLYQNSILEGAINFQLSTKKIEELLMIEFYALDAEGKHFEALSYPKNLVSNNQFDSQDSRIHASKLAAKQNTNGILQNGQIITLLSPGIKSTFDSNWNIPPRLAIYKSQN
jgi:hypothetical protein